MSEKDGLCMGIREGYKQTEVGVIPVDWEEIPFNQFITEFRGGAPLAPSDFVKYGYKVLPKGGVTKGGKLIVRKEKQQYCSDKYASNHKTNLVDGSYTIVVLRDLVPSGPTIGLMVKIDSNDNYILAHGVYGFKVNNSFVNSDFLIHLSNSTRYRKLMNSIMVGSTQVHVTNTMFLKVEIPCNSLNIKPH